MSLPSASEIRENIEVEVERSCGIDQHETSPSDELSPMLDTTTYEMMLYEVSVLRLFYLF